ncbi:MAG: RNA methyltransferase [Deltaproteobacteria bacterium]|nr:RNA methyltransferase [Deltaproteobacteria bacterium]
MGSLYVALIHYPVYDKNHDVVTSAVTNIDVHDIARSCCTYGVAGFYVVTPVDALRALVRRIMHHWADGDGHDYNPTRSEALALVHLEASLEGVEIDIEARHGRLPLLVSTSARSHQTGADAATVPITYDDLRARLDGATGAGDGESADQPWLLLLGTGWGLTEEVLDRCRYALGPLRGPSAYNHLSVRAAAAIILDRLRCPR